MQQVSGPSSDPALASAQVGYTISDLSGAIPANTTVTNVATSGSTITLTLSAAPTANVAGTDTFTVSLVYTGKNDGTTTVSSKTVSVPSGDTAIYNNAAIGQTITDSGGGIPAGTTITNVATTTGPGAKATLTLSAAATKASTTDTFTIQTVIQTISGPSTDAALAAAAVGNTITDSANAIPASTTITAIASGSNKIFLTLSNSVTKGATSDTFTVSHAIQQVSGPSTDAALAAAQVGYTITDSANAIPASTTVTAISTSGGTITLTLSAAPTKTASSDTFTISYTLNNASGPSTDAALAAAQVGDYVTDSGGGIPAGTTVTNVATSGGTITLTLSAAPTKTVSSDTLTIWGPGYVISGPSSDTALTAAAAGYTVTDSLGAVGQNAVVVSTWTLSSTTYLLLTQLSKAASTSDVFTVANPSFIIGGQPSASDSTNVAQMSPCWSYISTHGAQLDSPSAATGFATLGNICGSGSTACAYPSGSWYEGGGASGTPNGTGTTWVLGGASFLDIHTIDMELFTRQVPAATVASPSSSQIATQVANEGTEGVSIREVPPLCDATTLVGTTGFTDGALHPGPYCALVSSNWAPLDPGAKNQAIQIDANNHDPYIYFHGSIFMPDNNVTLYTSQPQRNVWLGAIDVNSIEFTFAGTLAAPIQIISGGNPSIGVVEIIATATDGASSGSGAAVSTEAVVNELTGVIESWRVCRGGRLNGFISACSS